MTKFLSELESDTLAAARVHASIRLERRIALVGRVGSGR
jgi:hypothetical protein